MSYKFKIRGKDVKSELENITHLCNNSNLYLHRVGSELKGTSISLLVYVKKMKDIKLFLESSSHILETDGYTLDLTEIVRVKADHKLINEDRIPCKRTSYNLYQILNYFFEDTLKYYISLTDISDSFPKAEIIEVTDDEILFEIKFVLNEKKEYSSKDY